MVNSAASEPLEGEFARFFGYSRDVLVILDGGGRVLMISPSAERLLGYPVETLLGRRLIHRVHPEDRAFIKAQARALVAGGTTANLDARVGHTDGSWVPMRWSLTLGAKGRMYGVGRDRTSESRRREALLNQEITELRLRTAMELHDGILQTLTGASFQIAVARQLVRQDPAAAEAVLDALTKSISAEQQEMRLYVDEIKGGASTWSGGATAADRIRETLDRVAVIWGLRVQPDIELPEELSAEAGRRVLRIVQEAAINAARHGGGPSVSVRVHTVGQEILVEVSDDGRGFSFLGEYDDDALKELRIGPLSLKHRVADAGGRISICSTRQGSSVSIRLPLIPEDLQ